MKTFDQCKDEVWKKKLESCKGKFWFPTSQEVDGLHKEAAELHAQEVAKDKMIAILDWYQKLTPSQKVSVWSKNGEFNNGLYDMDSEQLVEKFLQPPYQPNQERI